MLIIPEYGACFVMVPKTGGQALAARLEAALRTPEARTFAVEALHDYHANLEETESTGELPFSLYDMWSFAVVRNPFDRLVSFCAFDDPEFQHNPQHSMAAALQLVEEGNAPRWLWPQVHFTAGVKKLYRFEELPAAVQDINARLPIGDEPLALVNESVRERHAAYYDSELKARVESVYHEDLLTFGYRF